MNKSISVNIVCILLGVGLGFFLFSQNITTNSDSATETMKGMDMSSMPAHAMLEVDSSVPTPEVSVEVLEDAKDGYNLHLITENFRLTPENVNSEPVQGEGHAHVYVNGAKVARLYGEWFNLSSSELRDGENMIEVTLNANDHSEWVKNGRHISATSTVTK